MSKYEIKKSVSFTVWHEIIEIVEAENLDKVLEEDFKLIEIISDNIVEEDMIYCEIDSINEIKGDYYNYPTTS